MGAYGAFCMWVFLLCNKHYTRILLWWHVWGVIQVGICEGELCLKKEKK